MSASQSYASWQIEVSFTRRRVRCHPDPLEIPPDTIATITWYPATGSDFTFLQFEWIDKNGFLSQDPIVHDQCVIAAVNNTGPDTSGSWAYLLKVQVGDRVYESRDEAVMSDGHPRIQNQ